MNKLFVGSLLIVLLNGLWIAPAMAQTTGWPQTNLQQPDSQHSSSQKSAARIGDSKSLGFLELSFPTSSVETEVKSSFGPGVEAKNSYPFSLGIGLGIHDDNNRGFIVLSFEKMGYALVKGEEKSLSGIGFKLIYDRTFKPWITDLYLSGGLTYFPVQGDRIRANSIEFAPKESFGLEASIGWNSPINVAFNFGYKAVTKEYGYEKVNPNNSSTTQESSMISSGWVFVSASVGRY